MRHLPLRNELIPDSLEKAAKQKPPVSWETFSTSEDGKELRRLKAEEQQGLCAYCECRLTDATGKLPTGVAHIDHFYQRSRFPKLCFQWNNMLLSCMKKDSCGFYKDQQNEFPLTDLIDPHREDPRQSITFVCIAKRLMEATVVPESEPAVQERAQKTIRVLRLNAQRLSIARRMALWKYHDEIEALNQLLSVASDAKDIGDLQQGAQQILCSMQHDAYPSALLAYARSELSALLS